MHLHLVDPAELNADDPTSINQHRQAARESRSSVIEQLEASFGDDDRFQDGRLLSWNRFISRQRAVATVLEDCEYVTQFHPFNLY